MKTTLILTLAAAALLTGCGRKDNFAHKMQPAKTTLARVETYSNEEDTANVPPPPGSESTASALATQVAPERKRVMTAEDSQSILQKDEQAQNELNTALRAYQKSRGTAPQDLRELVTAKLIASVPVPPQGGQYILDASSQAIVWTRQ